MDDVCIYVSRVTFDIASVEPEVAAAAAYDDAPAADVVAAVVAAVVAGCYRVGDNADAGDSHGAVDEVADGLDVVDENANDDKVYRWWWCKYTGNGREPRPLIRALPRRHLLVLFLLPKQVRGPVREIEQSEYDGEEDP